MRSDIALLRRPESGGDVVWDAMGTGKEMSSRGTYGDNEDLQSN